MGIDWPKKVHSGKGLQVEVIELIAKVMWRAYPRQANITLELLKKESRENLFKIFTQEGALYEWSDKHGISLEHEVITLLQEERVDSDDEEDSTAAVMGICLHEVRKGSEHETKSKITGKLKAYI